MSNARRLKPREPDPVESAFAAELRKGCPYCGSRTVTARFRSGVWDFGLRCRPSCQTFREPLLAHRLASAAAGAAGSAIGQRLSYRQIDNSTGLLSGAVIAARAGGGL